MFLEFSIGQPLKIDILNRRGEKFYKCFYLFIYFFLDGDYKYQWSQISAPFKSHGEIEGKNSMSLKLTKVRLSFSTFRFRNSWKFWKSFVKRFWASAHCYLMKEFHSKKTIFAYTLINPYRLRNISRTFHNVPRRVYLTSLTSYHEIIIRTQKKAPLLTKQLLYDIKFVCRNTSLLNHKIICQKYRIKSKYLSKSSFFLKEICILVAD